MSGIPIRHVEVSQGLSKDLLQQLGAPEGISNFPQGFDFVSAMRPMQGWIPGLCNMQQELSSLEPDV
jgi:hypothetical protein